MAAYIRPVTVPVRGEVHKINAKSKTAHKFSLAIQLDQNHNKLKKLKNISENPNNFPEAN